MTKTILITGATDGIGLLTAKMLAEGGHRVLLHGRSAEKLAAAAKELGTSETFQADLSSLAETRAMGEEVAAKIDRLDVLINNAGVLKAPEVVLPNGQDIRFVVNILAPYILTKALLPLMPKTGRVINLSSAAQAPVDLAAMRAAPRLGDLEVYAQSKRAITLWSLAMAAALPEGPAVISVNPGSLLATKMVKEGFGIAGHDLRIGADILCRLALAPEHGGDSGKYWDNDAGQFAPVDGRQTADVLAAIEALTT